ncbi:MAG: rRNA pseudouridine synthase [Phycisphaeraceae bacterium]|nr:rRNA pseudouridine synthase [Phycisphaeraceae bacterium]
MNRKPKKSSLPPELTDASRGIRLQKALAEAGIASRRHAEDLITAGRVTVNSFRVTTLPAWVDPHTDRIEVDGLEIPRPRNPRNPRQSSRPSSHQPSPEVKTPAPAQRHSPHPDGIYLMLHKPRRVVSTVRDPYAEKTVLDLIPKEAIRGKRIYPVGRLDADSTGLILLTNDGDLAYRLTHPSFEVTKEYFVSVRGRLTAEEIQRLQEGLFLAHRPARAKPGQTRIRAKKAQFAAIRLLGYQRDETRGDRTRLAITLQEGQNREIRRLLARLGLKVRRLQRVAIGRLKLKNLAPGQWRMLTSTEVKSLYQSTKAPH